MFFQRLALAISFITVFLLKADTYTSIQGALPSTFRLPAMPGVTLTVTQGNGDGQGVIDHIQANGSFYAFDFAVGQTNFIVTAAQAGTVIGADDSSAIGCTTLSCWTQANCVLIANDDGKTAALYLHLLHNSLKVQPGMHVNQGDPLALADTTGFTTGPHLHFQVEDLPSTSAQQQKPSGWWWTQSQPVHFSNPEVFAQDPDGIPRTDQSFVVSGSSTSKPTTVPMPPTQTNCPTSGTARAAVIAPLALGNDQNVVYIDNEPGSGSLERYDVKTGKTTTISSAASRSIVEAQVSTDGQWVFFVSDVNGIAMFQLIRMDGQGLQTLYCMQSQGLSDVQWSPDQASIAFAVIKESDIPETTISHLGIKNGQLRTLSSSQGPLSGCCVFLHWLDAIHLAVVGSQGDRDVPDDGALLLLDTSQTSSSLKSIFQPTEPTSTPDSLGQPCYDFAPSVDQTQLFFSQCSLNRYFPMANEAIVAQGPSTVSVEPLTGGSSRTIYSNPQLAIVAIQPISQNKLLFYAYNYSNQQGQNVDTSQNGLWTINIDGSGLKHLTTVTVEEASYFFFSVPRLNWLVISRDGRMYASSTLDSSSRTQSLFFGSLNGGTAKTFLSRQFTYSMFALFS
jgi:hypothetical protein